MTDTVPQDASERARRPLHLDNPASRARFGSSSGGDAQLPTISPGNSMPSTPRGQLGRPLSGSWNSPGGSFRQDDEVFVIELGARFLRLGLGGESTPRAVMSFGPESRRRAGDYSAWIDGDDESNRPRRRRPDPYEVGDWACDQQLYPLDLRSADMALIALQFERAVRQAAAHHLLAVDDSKRRAVALTVQPQLPHPLLRRVLDTLFAHFPSPYQVAVLSTPMCATLAAGLRNALVIDVGWAETTVSAIYEMRELEHRRSERAMRRLNWEIAKMLVSKLDEQYESTNSAVTFDDCEEVLWRLCHCRKAAPSQTSDKEKDDLSTPIPLVLPSQPSTSSLTIPFNEFSDPVEATFFSSSSGSSQDRPVDDDDNLLTLPTLVYTTLLRLPPDVRGALLPRIIVTGGGTHIPRLTTRLLAEVTALIHARGWDPVRSYGSATSKKQGRHRPARAIVNLQLTEPAPEIAVHAPAEAITPRNKDEDPTSTTPAHSQPQLPDDVLAKIQRLNVSAPTPGVASPNTSSTPNPSTPLGLPPTQPSDQAGASKSSGVRAVSLRSLGAWTGASLLAGLRQRGVVEVERETYTAGGLASADREGGMGYAAASVAVEEAGKRRSREQEKRQSMIAGGRSGERRSGSWTLGAWAA